MTTRTGKNAKTPATQTPTPDLPLTPRPWQSIDIAYASGVLRDGPGVLIASAPGAGKTLVSVEIVKAIKPKQLFIVAPQGTHMGAWARTLRRQGSFDEVRTLIGTAKGKRAIADFRAGVPGAYITTPQWFARQDWSSTKVDFMIFDEVHMAGAYGIATSKALIGDGKKSGITARYRLGLSGTPLRNKFENAWVITKWLEESKLNGLDFWVWRLVKCETEYDAFAPQSRKVVGEKVPGELFNSLSGYIQHLQRSACCAFHPEGFLAHLEEPLHEDVITDMTKAQATFYRQMEDSLASSLIDESGAEVHVNAEQFIVARGMLRTAALALPSVDEDGKLFFADDAPSPKLDKLIADIPDYEGEHTLVLTHSKKFAKLAVDRLNAAGIDAEGWHGDVTKKRRDSVLARFISGDLKVIVGVIAAMGTGTDGLQEVCWNVSWMSYDDDPSNNIQGIGRLDRLGQDKRVVTRDYSSAETIDVGFFGKQMTRVMRLGESLRKESK